MFQSDENFFLEVVAFLVNPRVSSHEQSGKTCAIFEVLEFFLAVLFDQVFTAVECLQSGKLWEVRQSRHFVLADVELFEAVETFQAREHCDSVSVQVELEKLGHGGETSAVFQLVVVEHHVDESVVPREFRARLYAVLAQVQPVKSRLGNTSEFIELVAAKVQFLNNRKQLRVLKSY